MKICASIALLLLLAVMAPAQSVMPGSLASLQIAPTAGIPNGSYIEMPFNDNTTSSNLSVVGSYAGVLTPHLCSNRFDYDTYEFVVSPINSDRISVLGKINNALNFARDEAGENFVYVRSGTNFVDVVKNSFTVGVWVYWPGLLGSVLPVLGHFSSAPNRGFRVIVEANGQTSIYYSGPVGAASWTAAASYLPEDESGWLHIAYRHDLDRNCGQVFTNGYACVMGTATNNLVFVDPNTYVGAATEFLIGAIDSNWSVTPCGLVMDDFRFYTNALSDAAILRWAEETADGN